MNLEKTKQTLYKYFGNKYILTFAVFAVWVVFFDKANVINWVENVHDGHNMQKQKNYYQKEIKRIDESLKELNTSNESLEKFAREQFYFQNSDEDVYIIEEGEE